MTRCIGRRTSEAKADRRWSFTVYGAFQCKSPRPADGNICPDCVQRRARSSKGSTEASNWLGVVTDMGSIPASSHIAGSAWCLSGKPKWLGVARPKAVHRSAAAAAPAALPTGTAAAAPVAAVAVQGPKEGRRVLRRLLEAERGAHAATAARLAALELIHSRIAALATGPPPLLVEELN